MPSARYWRLAGIETSGYRADLELSGIALYDGGTWHAGDPTCVFTPSSGAIANLSDGNTNTSCRFNGVAVTKPGFTLVWDFGVAKSVNKLEFFATTAPNFIYRFEFQYSDDALTWTTIHVQSGIVFPGAGSSFWVDTTGDPYWNDVILLLHANGANASTTIVDSSTSARTVTTAAGQLTTAQARFGASSLLCGSGISYDVNLPAFPGDFTVELWVRHSATPSMSTMINLAGGYPSGLLFRQGWAGTLEVWIGGGNVNFSYTPVVGQWHFFQLVRVSGVFSVIVDGTQVGAPFTNNTSFPAGVFKIGASSHSASEVFVGAIDDVRVTAGIGRPAAMPFQEFGEVSGTAAVTVPRSLALSATTGAVIGTYALPAPQTIAPVKPAKIDTEDGGKYQIIGTVKESSSPSNIPRKRRVRLFNEESGRLVREAWSDPLTGAYQFNEIRGDTKYTVVCYDYTLAHRAAIADRVIPTKMV